MDLYYHDGNIEQPYVFTVRAVEDNGREVQRRSVDISDEAARRQFAQDVAAKCNDPELAAEVEAFIAKKKQAIDDMLDGTGANASGFTDDECARIDVSAFIDPADQEAAASDAAPTSAVGFSVGDDLVLDKHDPLPIARKFVSDNYTHEGHRTVLYADEVFHKWSVTSAYAELPPAGLRAEMYPWLERHKRIVVRKNSESEEPFQPTKANVDAAVDALKAITYVSQRAPNWLTNDPRLPDPSRLIVATNGIVDLAAPEIIRPPSPLLFTLNAVEYPYQPNAPSPEKWLAFLDELWPDDRESISLLQEWIGYLLTADTSQQKILLIVGPTRSGKGTVNRIIRRLLGNANVCAATLSGLGTNFGLWDLIGKLVAMISDARLSGRSDQAIIVERLLSISGEDAITIDRKNQSPVNMKLPTRIQICTNELPRLSDSSGALSNRFLVLVLERSFLGNEDVGLTERLLAELPGILQWAVQGWQRLRERGSFIQPATSRDAIGELQELSSPIGAFLRECCVTRAGACAHVRDLFDAWKLWCEEQGRKEVGDVARFGRDLRAVVPGLKTGQVRTDDGVVRRFEGIDLTLAAQQTLSIGRGKWEAESRRRTGT